MSLSTEAVLIMRKQTTSVVYVTIFDNPDDTLFMKPKVSGCETDEEKKLGIFLTS